MFNNIIVVILEITFIATAICILVEHGFLVSYGWFFAVACIIVLEIKRSEMRKCIVIINEIKEMIARNGNDKLR